MVKGEDRNEISNDLSARERCDGIRLRTVRNQATNATAVLYRSCLFPSLSQESPAFLLDFFRLEKCETTVHISLYNVTHRIDLFSSWVDDLIKMAKLSPPKDESEEKKAESPLDNSVMKVRDTSKILDLLLLVFVLTCDFMADFLHRRRL